jgi:hypothetical protein
MNLALYRDHQTSPTLLWQRHLGGYEFAPSLLPYPICAVLSKPQPSVGLCRNTDAQLPKLSFASMVEPEYFRRCIWNAGIVSAEVAQVHKECVGRKLPFVDSVTVVFCSPPSPLRPS